MGKILITGTGRCGTTFLVILYSKLNFDTGFRVENINWLIWRNCNSGMERKINENYRILKNPLFITNMENILKNNSIDFVIIPERDYFEAAKSRSKHGRNAGGFFGAKNLEEQVEFFNQQMAKCKSALQNSEVKTIYLDFDMMISSAEYVYEKLNDTFDRYVSFEEFNEAYIFSTNHQRK